eukprot:4858678-Alexandrium_andersonii.AAC.1
MMASLGNHGRRAQNIERDLHAWTRNLFDHGLEPYCITIDLLLPGSMVPQPVSVPCLLPHEVIHCIWKASAQQFRISMLGPRGHTGLQQYWAWATAQEWGRLHPGLQGKSTDELASVIPLFLHIDGAE